MTAHPVRLQLSRAKGFDLQRLSIETNGLLAVRVVRPGKWGNPWRVGLNVVPDEYNGTAPGGGAFVVELTAEQAVARFRVYYACLLAPDYPSRDLVRAALDEYLRGKNLACWCKPHAPCHADVLLELANA